MINTRALTKRYGAVTAVQSVDLDVREGDRYGLLGPNGSGKTTLVRMLLGLVYATSGEIEVMGRRIPRHAREVLPQIGALIEEPAAYPHLSGRANLALLDAAIGWARKAGLKEITLTTFRELAFNRGFYASAGFVEIAQHEMSERLAAIMSREARRISHG